MARYAFWNNKGGTGKSSLAFQSATMYAQAHPAERVLALDLCPQANLSELFLGGLMGNGSQNLLQLTNANPRRSVGGYSQQRLPLPYAVPAGLQPQAFISTPHQFNDAIPANIDLLAGDAVLELQTNAMATLANTQIPGTNTWLAVVDWLSDFINATGDTYQTMFIDANPSFSIYTQIALSAAERLVVPVMADDSSRRALQNGLALVHGINLPAPIYAQHSFSQRLTGAGRQLPRIHIVVKNRLTQYMGPASAYHAILTSIDQLIANAQNLHPHAFTFNAVANGVVDVRDFQTTGVVAFAEGVPFTRLCAGLHNIGGQQETQVNAQYITHCINAMQGLVALL
jgi:cellulose biosynthesis protein BcsQ